jgi:hypothetical protein
MTRRLVIDESHDIQIEPGPYPPGEGPLDYAECLHYCNDWTKPCAITWPQEGWELDDEPAQDPRLWDGERVDEDECTYCRTPVGYVTGEYEGEFGLRLVMWWVDSWSHPDADDIKLCEECVCVVEAWAEL